MPENARKDTGVAGRDRCVQATIAMHDGEQ
jgi:hypothetical protein